MKSLVLLLLSLFTTALASAEVLRVGLDPSYPPLQYMEDERIVGIEPDNATAVGRILGREVSLVPMAFAALIPALEAGRIDVIMSGMSATAERSERVAFSDPYLRAGQMAIMHRDKAGLFSQPWSVYREGVRVGVEPGTTGAAFAARELPDARVSLFPQPEAAFAALRENRIDLYIHDAATSWQLATDPRYADLISQHSFLTEEMLAWAVRRNDGQLLRRLNQALNLMRSNGTLSYILNRWIPVQVEVQ